MSVKKYLSKKWLHKRYVIEKKTAEEIAKECNVSKMTISRKLSEFEITKKR
jgi:DNA-directed RNA polymerase specialized sigma subunit